MIVAPPTIVLRKHRCDLSNYMAYNVTTGQNVIINESACNALILSRHGVSIERLFDNKIHLEYLIRKGYLVDEYPSKYKWKDCQIKLFNSTNADAVTFPFCDFPSEIEIKLTDACNFMCTYCFADSGGMPNVSNSINANIIYELFKEAESHNACRIIISGGEPFIHPDISDILINARDRAVRFIFLTNGTYLDRFKDQIDAENFHFVISLDSLDNNINDKIRFRGAFDSALNAIDVINDKRFSVTTVVTRDNISTLKDTIEFVSRMNPMEHNITTVENIGRASTFEQLSLNEIDYIRNLVSISTYTHKISFYDYATLTPRESGHGDIIFCSAGVSKCAVIPDGSVLPCLYAEGVRDLYIGNIYTNKISDIWKKHDDWRLFRGGITLQNLHQCKNCKISATCTIKNCRVRFISNILQIYDAPRWCGVNPQE